MLEDEVDEKYYLSAKWHYTLDNEQRHDSNEVAQIDNISYKAIRTITDTNKICRTIDTMGGGQREPKVIVEINNKRVRNNIEKNHQRLKENSFLDSFNNTVNNTGISGTITTGVSFRNETHVAVRDNRNLKEQLCDKLVETHTVVGGEIINHSYTNSKQRNTLDKYIESKDGIFPTMTTRPDILGVAENKNNLRIRKLTPKECWRLMGFDDSDFEKAEKVNSNSQLYKQARKFDCCKCTRGNI